MRNIFVWTVAFVVLLGVSYSFIPLPEYEPPIEDIVTEPGVFAITQETSYILQKEESYYLVSERETGITEDKIDNRGI